MLSFMDRDKMTLSDTDSGSSSDESDVNRKDVVYCGWSWDKYARPSRGILKAKSGPSAQKTTHHVGFKLTPQQESSVKQQYREGVKEAKAARRERLRGNGERFHDLLRLIFSRMQQNVNTDYLKTWNGILFAQGLVGKYGEGYGMDLRSYFDAREYVSQNVILDSENEIDKFEHDQFAHRFRKLIFAPAKLTP